MPEREYVRTASVYVLADSEEEAQSIVEDRNEDMEPWGIYIVLPDKDSEYKWEKVRG